MPEPSILTPHLIHRGAVLDYKATSLALAESLATHQRLHEKTLEALMCQITHVTRLTRELAIETSAHDETSATLREFYSAPFLLRLRYLFTGSL